MGLIKLFIFLKDYELLIEKVLLRIRRVIC